MNDVAMNASPNGQNAAYFALQSVGKAEAASGSYSMDFSEVFDGGPQITVSGNLNMLSRSLCWGSGHVIVNEDGTRRMKIDSYTQVDFETGTVTRAAFSDFFASSGDKAAAASLRAAVSFSAGYLPGQLQGTVSALCGAYRARRDAVQNQPDGAEQLRQLDHLYQQGKDIAMVSFAKSVGGFLDQFAPSGQQDKIYRSAQAAAAVLEGGVRSAQAGRDGLYTLEELDFAAVSVNACKTLLENTQNGDGVRQLLYVNRLEMEARSMAGEGKIGEDLAELLCTAERTAFHEIFTALERAPAHAGGLDLRG